jgi:hypothetical protein
METLSDLIDVLLDIEEEQQPEDDYIWLDGSVTR